MSQDIQGVLERVKDWHGTYPDSYEIGPRLTFGDLRTLVAAVEHYLTAITEKGGTEYAPTEDAYLSACHALDVWRTRGLKAEAELAATQERLALSDAWAKDEQERRERCEVQRMDLRSKTAATQELLRPRLSTTSRHELEALAEAVTGEGDKAEAAIRWLLEREDKFAAFLKAPPTDEKKIDERC